MSALNLPTRNAAARELLSVLADVLNLADAMGVTVRAGDWGKGGSVTVHLDEKERAAQLAAAMDGAPFPTHYPAGPQHPRFTTWTATHRGVRVVVFGTYAGDTEAVAS